MTPEIIVHHPIPDDLMKLLVNCGYQVDAVQKDRTTFRLSPGQTPAGRTQTTTTGLAVSPRRAAELNRFLSDEAS